MPRWRDRGANVLPLPEGNGCLQVDQAKRLKELEQENAKLKRLVSELSLEKLVLGLGHDASRVS